MPYNNILVPSFGAVSIGCQGDGDGSALRIAARALVYNRALLSGSISCTYFAKASNSGEAANRCAM